MFGGFVKVKTNAVVTDFRVCWP